MVIPVAILALGALKRGLRALSCQDGLLGNRLWLTFLPEA